MSDLSTFYSNLNTAFSSPHISERAKEAAIHDFIQRATERNLSFAEASDELKNSNQINQSVAIGKKVDEYA